MTAARTAERPPDGRAAPPDSLVAELVAEVRKVPDRHRRFTCDTRQARSEHAMDVALLQRLTTAGLPSAEIDGQAHYDPYDLGNIALHLGLVTARRMAVRSWGLSLARGRRGTGSYVMQYVPTCPVPGHSGPCQYTLTLPGGERVAAEVSGPLAEPYAVTVPVSRTPGLDLPVELTQLCEEISQVRFFLLPEEVRWDAAFMRGTGLGDCGGGSVLLLDGARRLGLTARLSFGLLLAQPFSTPHFWTEVWVDDTWVPLDPLLVAATRRWSGHVPDGLPAHYSPSSMVVRVSDGYLPYAVHLGDDDVPARTSFPTSYHPATGGT